MDSFFFFTYRDEKVFSSFATETITIGIEVSEEKKFDCVIGLYHLIDEVRTLFFLFHRVQNIDVLESFFSE